jgi:hypothetical protein
MADASDLNPSEIRGEALEVRQERSPKDPTVPEEAQRWVSYWSVKTKVISCKTFTRPTTNQTPPNHQGAWTEVEPMYKAGDVIWIHYKDGERLKTGDIFDVRTPDVSDHVPLSWFKGIVPPEKKKGRNIPGNRFGDGPE